MTGELLVADGCYSFVCICRGFYVFFPPGPEVTLGRELGMCEVQVPLVPKLTSARASADRSYVIASPRAWGSVF